MYTNAITGQSIVKQKTDNWDRVKWIKFWQPHLNLKVGYSSSHASSISAIIKRVLFHERSKCRGQVLPKIGCWRFKLPEGLHCSEAGVPRGIQNMNHFMFRSLMLYNIGYVALESVFIILGLCFQAAVVLFYRRFKMVVGHFTSLFLLSFGTLRARF